MRDLIIGRHFSIENGIDYINDNGNGILLKNEYKSENGRGRPSVDYFLTIETAKEISMLQRTEKGKEARKYFIECERQLKKQVETKPSISLIDLSNPTDVIRGLNEITALWLKKEEENKELIRTKAWIGEKREATAMAKASVMVRKVNKLEDELGEGKNFKAVAM